MTDRFCINCVHAEPTSDDDTYKCKAVSAGEADLVTGKRDYPFCSIVRMISSQCGREGRLFEPIPPVNIEDIFPNFPSIRG